MKSERDPERDSQDSADCSRPQVRIDDETLDSSTICLCGRQHLHHRSADVLKLSRELNLVM